MWNPTPSTATSVPKHRRRPWHSSTRWPAMAPNLLPSADGQAGGPGVQVTLLREVAGQAGRGEIGLARGRALAGHLEQVGADRGQPVVPGEALVRLEPAEP